MNTQNEKNNSNQIFAEKERTYDVATETSMNIKPVDFIEVYFRDKEGELKERTIRNKRDMIDMYIIPFFGEQSMNEIVPSQIISWQNNMRKRGFSQTYLRIIQNQITALFNHAANIYDLANTPCRKVKQMGKSGADRLDFWTINEYHAFIETFDKRTMYYVLFQVLFWTGARIGEVLALTMDDIDCETNRMYINKTFYRADQRDIITLPKTENSIRTVELPSFLTKELRGYLDGKCAATGDSIDSSRIFPIVNETVQHNLKFHAELAGVKRIRVHDLRHSHVAYLINKGVEPLLIKERLGHKDIKITLNTYGHLYPSRQREVADMLDEEETAVPAGYLCPRQIIL